MRVSWILVYDTQGDDPAGRGCGRRQGRSDGEEIDVEPDEEDLTFYSTVRVDSLPHRKWKEFKQQPSMLPGPAVPGSCLVSFHFLWAILCPQAVGRVITRSK